MPCRRTAVVTGSRPCASAAAWASPWSSRRCNVRETPVDRIRIAPEVLAAIEAHARAEAPRECCGLLVGIAPTESEPAAVIHLAAPAHNLASTPTRYDLDPADHFR